MCMILDTNKFGDFSKGTPDMKPIHKWLSRGGRLIYSNHRKVWDEIKKSGRMWRYFTDIKRKKQAKLISRDKVEKAMQDIIKSEYALESDDSHILGLARAGNVKLLCTEDTALITDFKKIVRNGTVYNMRYKGSYRKQSIIQKQAKDLLTKSACP